MSEVSEVPTEVQQDAGQQPEDDDRSAEAGNQDVLQLPHNLNTKTGLEKKLEEYRSRQSEADGFKAPELQPNDVISAVYKQALVEPLLKNGTVNIADVRAELQGMFGDVFRENVFENAVAVVQDYITTGGKNVEGGDPFVGMESATATGLADKAAAKMAQMEERQTQRAESRTEMGAAVRDKINSLKGAVSSAWGGVTSRARKIGSGATRLGGAAVDAVASSRVVGKVDELKTRAEAGLLNRAARLVERADQITSGAADRIDALGRNIDAAKAGVRAKTAELRYAAVAGSLNVIKSALEAGAGRLDEAVNGKEVNGEVVQSRIQKVKETGEQQRALQEAAKKRGQGVGRVRRFLRRFASGSSGEQPTST